MKKYHVQTAKRSHRAVLRKMYRDRHIYFLLLPAIIATLVFAYGPMPGLIMAFEDYSIYDGLFGSKWVGFQNIVRIFTQAKFTTAIWNTLKVSVLNIIITFPAPIILALLMNELKSRWFKKTVQTVSYLPHFLSWMSVVGLIHILFGRDGIINDVRMALGASERITYLSVQSLFIRFVLGTALWKEIGWGTVIHLANISSINQELYEAAEMDGAGHFKKVWYITLPHMIPTIIILLIFQMGGLFSSNFELIYGLQNPYIDFEVISTIVYRTGVQNGNYSMSTAVGFVQGLVALILVVATNWVSKKVSDVGIF